MTDDQEDDADDLLWEGLADEIQAAWDESDSGGDDLDLPGERHARRERSR